MILLWEIAVNSKFSPSLEPQFHPDASPCSFFFFLCYFLIIKQSNTKSSFLFKSIFDYTWFQHNFKGYCSILLHVDEKFYIYGATDKNLLQKIATFVCCVWMKSAARGLTLHNFINFPISIDIKQTLHYKVAIK